MNLQHASMSHKKPASSSGKTSDPFVLCNFNTPTIPHYQSSTILFFSRPQRSHFFCLLTFIPQRLNSSEFSCSPMGNCCSLGKAAQNAAKEEARNAENAQNRTNQQANGQANKQANRQTNQQANQQAKQGSPKRERPPKRNNPIGPVLGRPMDDVKAQYTMGKELGRGQFGITHICTHKQTGEQFACKTIAKRKLTSREDVEDVKREVQIMHHLTGQPNIVELKGAFEDKHEVHLVMELCAGGELFDRIIAKGHYTERAAASLLRTIVQIVRTCHQLGVIHRDLKPENFLLLNDDEDAPLKATDFGLSVFYKQGYIFFFWFWQVTGSLYKLV